MVQTIKIKQPLIFVDGLTPFKQQDGSDLTISHALIEALAFGPPIEADLAVERWHMAVSIANSDSIELSREDIQWLTHLIAKRWPPLVAGALICHIRGVKCN